MTPKASNDTRYSHVASPIGELLVVGRDGALAGLYLENHARGPRTTDGWTRDDAFFAPLRAQMAAWFAGERTTFELPLSLAGTPFQRQVWSVLQTIPFGETITYGELARRVGVPTAARAVGHCNARNPISIVVPCHRVVGANGSLTGYAGGEARKRWLLDWETRVLRGAKGRAAACVA